MHVFTYGSLMYATVWSRVVSGRYRTQPATLRGFARRAIINEVYPALVAASPENSVQGLLYLDVSDPDLAALDRFEGEGDAYRRIRVTVESTDGLPLEAWAYLYLKPAQVEGADWVAERFEAEHLGHFLNTYGRERGGREGKASRPR